MKKILSFLMALGLLLIPSAFILDKIITSPNFYHQTQIRYEVADSVQMSQADLDQAMAVLLDYTQGKRTDLSVDLPVAGLVQPIFNEREKLHMVDVKVLYQNLTNFIKIGSLFCMVVLLLYVRLYGAKLTILDYYPRITAGALILVAILGLLAYTNFEQWWFTFHHLIFTNDLWLLNPATDLLINFVPEALFFRLVFKIVLFIASYLVITNGLVLFLSRKLVKHD